MDTITILLGRIETTTSGIVQDRTQAVRFDGEKLAECIELGPGRQGGITDTRGTTETLYHAEGKLIVHTADWSHWEGEPTIYYLHEVIEADLQPTGRFAALGEKAGYGRPLTLAEALEGLPPTCEGCGADLPAGGSPYWLDKDRSIHLCDKCAGGEDVIP